jgi:hypothetical protein
VIEVHYTGKVICKVTLADWLTSQGQEPLARKVLEEGTESLEGKWGDIAFGDERHLRDATADEAVLIAAQEAEAKASRAATNAPREAEIARITDGLDRETVMALASKVLVGGGYWPTICAESLEVYNTSDQKIVWRTGDSSWSQPICTRGNRGDVGAGYGSNE